MRTTLVRATSAGALFAALLSAGPSSLVAQEGHEAAAEHEPAAAHEQEAEHQDHDEHATHAKNEIAVFVGGTRRLKFEEDETGGTIGLEYARAISPKASASLGVEFSTGEIERDWIATFKINMQPFEGWAHPILFSLGTGVEVGRIDEALLEEDEGHGEGEAGGEEHGGEAAATSEEHGESGERETEVDALMRLGAGWVVHAGSFSIIPNANFDLVGEDWSIVFGVTLGYRF